MCLHITAQVKGIVGCCLGIFTLEGVAIERMEAAEDGEPSLVVNTGDGLFLDTVPLARALLVSASSMLSCTPLRAAVDHVVGLANGQRSQLALYVAIGSLHLHTSHTIAQQVPNALPFVRHFL